MSEKQRTLEGKEIEVGSRHLPTGGKVFRNYRNEKGKSIGLIIEIEPRIRLFWKSVKREKHFHRNHRSWAIAASLMKELAKEQIDYIVLQVMEEDGTVHSIAAAYIDFVNRSIIDQFPPHEEQMFLHESYWQDWKEK
jgi:hypothetical protein